MVAFAISGRRPRAAGEGHRGTLTVRRTVADRNASEAAARQTNGMAPEHDPYYRRDLALAHHLGYGFHAEACAPGILALLEPVRARGGLVLELGCGSGLLTRELIGAGHRVIATDASPAMLDIARGYVTGAQDIRRLTLPDDPLPAADAVVSVGHVLSYLPDADAITAALTAIARALRPGGLFAIDLCDLSYGQNRRDSPPLGRRGLGRHQRDRAAGAGPLHPPDHRVHAQRRRLLAP